MGRSSAADMVEQGGKGEEILRWHLQHNHYPPVHPIFIPVAQRAIEEVNNGNGAASCIMPNKIRKTYWEIIEGLHLQDFLEGMMTKKDEELIAYSIKRARNYLIEDKRIQGAIDMVVECLMVDLRVGRPRFKRDKFMEACKR